MNVIADGLVKLRFAFGATGLVCDEKCVVTMSDKEAKQLGVREGWVAVAVNGQPARNGVLLTELLDNARRRCGWTPKSAQEFWKSVAEPRLVAACEHWPGDKTQRLNLVHASLKRMAQKDAKSDDMMIWFAKDAHAADYLMVTQRVNCSPTPTTHSCRALFRSLGGDEYVVSFNLCENLRALRSRLAGAAGFFTDQVTIILSDGTRLGERGCRRDDAQSLSECGVSDGMEAVMITIGQPLDGCLEFAADDRLKDLLAESKFIVEGILGRECIECIPVSYSAGLNPFQGEHGLSHLHLMQLSAMEQRPWEVDTILECMQKMRPVGEDIMMNVAEVLRHPSLAHALANYDAKSLEEDCKRDVQRLFQTLEGSILRNDLFSRLMKQVPAASTLLSWLLFCLPFIASRQDAHWVKSLQAAELVVKCRIGQEQFIHVLVHVCNNQATVKGIQEGKHLHDLIEWFCPGSQSSFAKAPVKKMEVLRTLTRERSLAWR